MSKLNLRNKTKKAYFFENAKVDITIIDIEGTKGESGQTLLRSHLVSGTLYVGLRPYEKGTFDCSQNLIRTPSGDFKDVSEDF